ncbi:MAG TPA: outer membrane lipoprotein carrier protein LolA [Actinophytocola sp.]|uniref:LolA family protein n=1 Tax=Actinophytocola sp. TaxID=1872138 RepID=UPI002DB823EF|nr:outer membrane lipoprotein carrier protein LolA [Actinophytocola sp.]HEU5472086.1 outer membrane lipoprotein carrier protein LolA [Actinophytocola sp.]
MNRKRSAIAVAATGTAAGVVGLVVLATPAGAGEPPPALPAISAEELVASVLTTKVPAMSGAVSVEENLGLPIPVLPSGDGDGTSARVYSDGAGKGRIAMAGRATETTVVADGDTVWIWNSTDRSVRKVEHGQSTAKQVPEQLADPATAAQQLVKAMQEESTVAVDGTARVAGRPVYQLLLTPKPTEKTLLREVKVAVDAELRVPLRLEVLANGQAEPALRIGFTEFAPGAQDPALFRFDVPPGATVTEVKPGEHVDPKAARDLFAQVNPTVVGSGWDTVLIGKVPTELLSAAAGAAGGPGQRPDMGGLVRQFAKPVTGSFGSGWVVTTKVGAALVTQDGRVAVGAVPEQVLIDALGKAK